MISGKLQSGKSTFAQLLADKLATNHTVVQDMFAHDLKHQAAKYFAPLAKVLKEIKDGIGDDCYKHYKWLPVQSKHWNDLELHSTNFFEDKTPISRCLLQIFGTEIVRGMISDRYWIDKIEERTLEEEFDFKIITDLRFKNEMEAFGDDSFNVVTIRVEREMDREAIENEHESEKDLDGVQSFNYFVDNNGTLSDLEDAVSVIVKDIAGIV